MNYIYSHRNEPTPSPSTPGGIEALGQNPPRHVSPSNAPIGAPQQPRASPTIRVTVGHTRGGSGFRVQTHPGMSTRKPKNPQTLQPSKQSTPAASTPREETQGAPHGGAHTGGGSRFRVGAPAPPAGAGVRGLAPVGLTCDPAPRQTLQPPNPTDDTLGWVCKPVSP